MKTLNVKLTFIEPILGTSPASPDIYREYIASKSPNATTIEEEIAALGVDGVAEKGTTIFMRDKNGDPFLYDYHVKGFFKEACKANKKISGSISSKIKAYKQEINDLIFPEPRCITIHFDGVVGECQRPLRAQTAQGERVSLANSEEIPAGAWIAFSVVCMCDEHEAAVREWLDYGKWKGLGHWRNSGKGRFVWEEIQ